MSLIDLKNYLSQRREASLSEIANYLSADPETTRGMLAVWQRKGKVVCHRAAKCSGCNQCDGATLEVYQWQG
jgi:putative ferrous iron transport protein C